MKSNKEIKGCGNDVCLVETYNDLSGEDIYIQVWGEYCPYHKAIHYCRECEQKLGWWKRVF